MVPSVASSLELGSLFLPVPPKMLAAVSLARHFKAGPLTWFLVDWNVKTTATVRPLSLTRSVEFSGRVEFARIATVRCRWSHV